MKWMSIFIVLILSFAAIAQNDAEDKSAPEKTAVGRKAFLKQVSFSAKPADGKVIVNWKVDAEFLNRYFFLERSPDGDGFTVITEFPGRSALDGRRSFRFDDGMVTNGETYVYRLASLGEGGEVVYHQKIRVTPSVGFTELNTAQTQ